MNELYHHGVKGQKWGVRRYQNPDGSLTAAGQKRQLKREYKKDKKVRSQLELNASYGRDISRVYDRQYARVDKKINKYTSKKKQDLEKIERLKQERDSLKKSGDTYKAANKQAVANLKKHVDGMVDKYGDKKVKSVETYSKSGEEYLKAKLGVNNHAGEINLRKYTISDRNTGKQISWYTLFERIYYYY